MLCLVDLDQITWALAESHIEGRRLLTRFREFERAFPRELFPERINIFWTMEAPDEAGLASDDEAEALKEFEDRLVNAVEPANHSVLAIAMTTGGVREWVFHTGDVEGFVERLTNMPQNESRYPITIQHHHDPEWHYDDLVTQFDVTN
jgi:hypothetical protein